MALVFPKSSFPGSKTWASQALSTNADGITGADLVDSAGGTLAGIELSSNSTDANYSLRASIDSTANLKTVLNSTGGVVTFGTTAAGVSSNRIITFDPSPYEGLRYLQVMSGTTAAPIPAAAGSEVKIYFSDRNPQA
jgi:hypothetical protein